MAGNFSYKSLNSIIPVDLSDNDFDLINRISVKRSVLKLEKSKCGHSFSTKVNENTTSL